jgi:hypothetical protein
VSQGRVILVGMTGKIVEPPIGDLTGKQKRGKPATGR